MQNTTYVTVSQQSGLRRQMEVIANNLANASTFGFKADRMLFAEHLTRGSAGPGLTGAGTKMSFVEEAGTLRDTRDGPIMRTGNVLDLAIRGAGYFTVETPGGKRYTRIGNLRLDGEGKLVTGEGYAVLGASGQPITFNATDTQIEISRTGQITSESGELGRIQIAHFENEQVLRKIGTGLYEADVEPVPADPKTEIHQGMIEGSNVQSILEITNMIELTRRYQASQRIVDNEHERERRTIERLMRVG